MVKSKLIFLFIILFIFINLIILAGALPSYFDWRNKDGQNWMTEVKDQKTCGSCWAFASVGLTEAQYNIAENNASYNLNLSEENLISNCSNAGNCAGGYIQLAFNYIKNIGIVNESCFPYVDSYCNGSGCTYGGTNAKCSDNQCTSQQARYKIDNYESIQNNITDIENWLVNTGPVSANMYYADYNWDNNLVMHCNPDSGLNNWHSIVITGYNQTGQYWIVKNSWGKNWMNDGGYFKVGFGECSIENSVYGEDLNLCQCTDWTAGSCGGPGQTCATQAYRMYTRTCDPTACEVQTKCQYDFSCLGGGGGNPKEITVCASGCNYTTIQNAINHSNNVDVVIVKDNRTYNEQLRMNYSTASRLQCLGNATIQGSGSGIGINISSKDSFSISGCRINSFSYGIRIRNTDYGVIENTIISNNGYGILIENQSHDYQLMNVTVIGTVNKGIRLETETWGSSYAAEITIQDSNISNNGYVGIFNSMGIYNDFKNNNVSGHSNFGIHMYTNDWNAFNTIENNKLFNNGRGIYLEVSSSNTINNNNFCPSNTNYDIDLGSSTYNQGDDNTCEKPGSWNDAGTTGCTDYCYPGASVTLLFPPNNYVNTEENISLTCEADDSNNQLVNISLYHNISGSWQINQTKSISGNSNISTFNVGNLINGTNFAWNCLAYSSNSRGGFAPSNWTVSILVDNIPPNVNVISPLNQTYNVSSIDFNVTINEDGTCEYSLNNGVTNNSMNTIDNSNFTATDSVYNGNHFVHFYCMDVFGNLNYTEGISFNVSAIITQSPPNDTNKFYIRNATGGNVAWFGNLGNIALKGSCMHQATCTAPANSFIIANYTDNTTAYIDNSGNLCVEKGDCSDNSASCNPARNAFIVRNLSNYNMSYIDFDGDLCLKGNLYQNSTYV